MMSAATKAGGSCMGMPDVCLVPAPPAPPIPTPFPNNGMLSNATKTSTKVLIENKETVTETSEIPNSMGDQAGVNGGQVSGTVGDKITMKLGSTRVIAEGKGVFFQTGMSAHNGANANMPAGLHAAPSQMKVTVMP